MQNKKDKIKLLIGSWVSEVALLICHPTGDNGLHMEIQFIFHFQFEWNSREPTLIKIIMSNNQTNKTNMFGKTNILGAQHRI